MYFSLLFRKDFYIEVPELAKMTDAEVDDYRTEMEGIKVSGSFNEYVFTHMFIFKCKGKNVPKPIKNWPQCGVSSKILNLLKKYSYDKPTPIQVLNAVTRDPRLNSTIL